MLYELNEIWKNILESYKESKVCFYDDIFYTYEDIDIRSWIIADYLEKHVDSTYIGVMLDSSYDYICTILGIIKSGKCFVPIGTDWPEERVEYVIKDCDIEYVITAESQLKVDTIHLSDLCFDKEDIKTDRIWIQGELAYILYSSGTTGNPKGIKIKTESLANLIVWFGNTYMQNGTKNVLQLAKNTFDVSIEEIFGTIFNGGTLFIPQQSVRYHKGKLRQFINDYEIHLVEVVPATLKEFFSSDDKIDCLKTIICGADVLHDDLKNAVLEKGYGLYNNYGPTEATVDALYYRCEINEPVQLGNCISGCELIVLDDKGSIISESGIGELLLSGVNITPGYVGNDSLNSEKFIIINTKRYYKTGDIVKRDNKGRIVFIGRTDNQIKLRGQKIELGEIESVFAEEMQISLCAAICKKEDSEKLILFYESQKDFERDDIIGKLKTRLPDYMIPSVFEKMETLPLTDNGKVDRKALSQIDIKRTVMLDLQDIDDETNLILEVMSEVLEVPANTIDLSGTLEEIGFDSISFVRFLVEVEDKWDVEMDDDLLVPDDEMTAMELIEEIKKII